MKIVGKSYLILLTVLMFAAAIPSTAQTVDSTAYVSVVAVMQANSSPGEGKVSIRQSSSISHMLNEHALTNQKNQSMPGWRVRIYRDNSQTARPQSERIKAVFSERYPNMPAYRFYRAPYFTVIVGDFRTADEANKFLRQLKNDYSEYSNSWIVEDKINFPPL